MDTYIYHKNVLINLFQIERLTRELRESEQRRTDQESLATSLEQRYLVTQRELNAAQDMTDKLRAELAFKSTQLKQVKFQSY